MMDRGPESFRETDELPLSPAAVPAAQDPSQRMRRLVKNMSIYGLGGVLGKAIQFLLLPVYTRVLAPADYGALELVYITANLLTLGYGLMIGSGYVRIYFDSREQAHRDMALGSAFWFTFLCVVIGGPLAFTFAPQISGAVFDFSEGAHFLRLIIISAGIQVHSRILYSNLMVRERARQYVTVTLSSLVITLSVTIFLVVKMNMGVEGVLIAQIIAYSLELLILCLMIVRRSIFHYAASAVREMLYFSVPLIPLQLAAFVLSMSDRFFLQKYQSLSEVGLYALGAKFAGIIPLLTVEPLKAFAPHLFNLIDTPEKCKATLADFTRYFLAGSLFLALAIALFSREVLMVMSNKAYQDSYQVIYILSISYVFFGMYTISCYPINIVKKNWIIAVSWAIVASCNVALNILLVPRYGMIGAACASMCSYLLVVVGNMLIVKRVYPVNYRYRSYLGLFATATLIYGVSSVIGFGVAVSAAAKLGLLALFPLLMVYTGYITRDEITRGRELFVQTIKRFRSTD